MSAPWNRGRTDAGNNEHYVPPVFYPESSSDATTAPSKTSFAEFYPSQPSYEDNVYYDESYDPDVIADDVTDEQFEQLDNQYLLPSSDYVEIVTIGSGGVGVPLPAINEVPGGRQGGVTVVAFDPVNELLWRGTMGGWVSSYECPSMTLYSSFACDPHFGPVRAIIVQPSRGVTTITSGCVRIHGRGGYPRFSMTDIAFLNPSGAPSLTSGAYLPLPVVDSSRPAPRPGGPSSASVFAVSTNTDRYSHMSPLAMAYRPEECSTQLLLGGSFPRLVVIDVSTGKVVKSISQTYNTNVIVVARLPPKVKRDSSTIPVNFRTTEVVPEQDGGVSSFRRAVPPALNTPDTSLTLGMPLVVVGGDNGSLVIRDAVSLEVKQTIPQVHLGGVTSISVCSETMKFRYGRADCSSPHATTSTSFPLVPALIATCGLSTFGRRYSVDPFIKFFDFRKPMIPLQPCLVLEFPGSGGPHSLKWHPRIAGRLAVIGMDGAVWMVDITVTVIGGGRSGVDCVAYMDASQWLLVDCEGDMLSSFDISPSGDLLGFGDSGGFTHLWAHHKVDMSDPSMIPTVAGLGVATSLFLQQDDSLDGDSVNDPWGAKSDSILALSLKQALSLVEPLPPLPIPTPPRIHIRVPKDLKDRGDFSAFSIPQDSELLLDVHATASPPTTDPVRAVIRDLSVALPLTKEPLLSCWLPMPSFGLGFRARRVNEMTLSRLKWRGGESASDEVNPRIGFAPCEPDMYFRNQCLPPLIPSRTSRDLENQSSLIDEDPPSDINESAVSHVDNSRSDNSMSRVLLNRSRAGSSSLLGDDNGDAYGETYPTEELFFTIHENDYEAALAGTRQWEYELGLISDIDLIAATSTVGNVSPMRNRAVSATGSPSPLAARGSRLRCLSFGKKGVVGELSKTSSMNYNLSDDHFRTIGGSILAIRPTKPYAFVEILSGKMAYEEFDFIFHNPTRFSGLENSLPNSYANAALILLYWIVPLRLRLLHHHCVREDCVSCQLSFLFHMMQLSRGRTCEATNFHRVFRLNDRARSARIVQTLAGDAESDLNLVPIGRRLEAAFDILLSQIHSETVVTLIPPTPDPGAPEPKPVPDVFIPSAAADIMAVTTRETLHCSVCVCNVHKYSRFFALPLRYPENQTIKSGSCLSSSSSSVGQDGTLFIDVLNHSFGVTEASALVSQRRDWCAQCCQQRPLTQTRRVVCRPALPDILTFQCNVDLEEEGDGNILLWRQVGPRSSSVDETSASNSSVGGDSDFTLHSNLESWNGSSVGSRPRDGSFGNPIDTDDPGMWLPSFLQIKSDFQTGGVIARDDRYGFSCLGALSEKYLQPNDTAAFQSYELVCLVARIRDVEYHFGEGSDHFVSIVKMHRHSGSAVPSTANNEGQGGTPSRASANLVSDTVHQSSSAWYLFNDFSVTQVTAAEALQFYSLWKVPSLVVYAKPHSNGLSRAEFTPLLQHGIPHLSILPAVVLSKRSFDLTTSPISVEDVFSLENDVAEACGTSEKMIYTLQGSAQPHSEKSYWPITSTTMPNAGDFLAIDAEFVLVGRSGGNTNGSVSMSGRQYRPGRVSVLNSRGDVIIDDYIARDESEPVVDYLTQFSGLRAEDLDPNLAPPSRHLVTVKCCYIKLRCLIDRGCIFVGHGLKKDFRILNLVVPPSQVVDTVDIFHLPHQRRIALRYLAAFFLRVDIQSNHTMGHDSIEDARTALLLFHHHEKIVSESAEGESGVSTFEGQLRELYRVGRISLWDTSAIQNIRVESAEPSII